MLKLLWSIKTHLSIQDVRKDMVYIMSWFYNRNHQSLYIYPLDSGNYSINVIPELKNRSDPSRFFSMLYKLTNCPCGPLRTPIKLQPCTCETDMRYERIHRQSHKLLYSIETLFVHQEKNSLSTTDRKMRELSRLLSLSSSDDNSLKSADGVEPEVRSPELGWLQVTTDFVAWNFVTLNWNLSQW